MCRCIRTHPAKTIFVILIMCSLIHVIYKLLPYSSNHYLWDIDPLQNIVSINSTKLTLSNRVNLNVTDFCELKFDTLKSSIPVDQEEVSLESLENLPWTKNLKNGHWSPPHCKSRYNVAIIIPYRNREKHLNIFLRHMHPFLQKQLISYGIFVIEQALGTRFNRAALFNVGYVEAIKSQSLPYDCFIFHDVDLLPTNENNFYKCNINPLHLSVAIDKFNYQLPYNSIFGGAVALSKEQFLKVNGFSNIFYGWGGEDDDMSGRISAVKYSIARYPNSVSRYVMIRHKSDSGNPVNAARFKLLKNSGSRYKNDGVSTLKYSLVENNYKKSNLMKLITVQFPETEVLKQWNI